MAWRSTQLLLLWPLLQLFAPGGLQGRAEEGGANRPVGPSRYSIPELQQVFERLSESRAALERELHRFRTKEDVDRYLEKNKDRLDPIEGYWIFKFQDGDRPERTAQRFIIRKNESCFVMGEILENNAVKFYTASDIQIEKKDDAYVVIGSEASRAFGWINAYSPFALQGDRFEFTSDTRVWDKEAGRLRKHQFDRVQADPPAHR